MNTIKVSLALILIAQLSGCKLPPPTYYPAYIPHDDHGITAAELESILYNRERANYNQRFQQRMRCNTHKTIE